MKIRFGWILIITVAMVLALGGNVLAATLSLDFFPDGKGSDPLEYSTKSMYLAGLEAPMGCGKLGLEYFTAKMEDGYDSTVWGYFVKAGLSLAKSESFRAGVNLGFFNEYIDNPTFGDSIVKIENYVMVGFDSDFALARNLSLALSADFGLSNQNEGIYFNQSRNVSVAVYKAKLNWFANENLGLGVGYDSKSYKWESAPSEVTIHGLTAGLVYKF